MLDVILTKWLKEIQPLFNSTLFRMISLSLLTGYLPQAFKVDVIKPFLKKLLLYPLNLAN